MARRTFEFRTLIEGNFFRIKMKIRRPEIKIRRPEIKIRRPEIKIMRPERHVFGQFPRLAH